MTVGTPAVWAGSATHTTRTARHGLLGTVLGLPMISHANSATATTRGGGYGVAGGGDLAVTTTGALGYSIAAGHFALPGTFATAQGPYGDYNDAAVAGTLPARDAANPYIAYICARVRDTDEDATGSEVTDFAVVQGTPAASPAAPAVPSSLGSLLILSEALVPSTANGGAVVFTNRRMYLSAIGGRIRCTSATRPTGAALWEGVEIRELDTHSDLIYDGAAWVYQFKPITSYTPTTSSFTLGNATFTAGYSYSNGRCFYDGVFTLGTTTAFGGSPFALTLSTPVAKAGSGRDWGEAMMYDSATNTAWPANCEATGSVIQFTSLAGPQGNPGTVDSATNKPFTWGAGDSIAWSISYPI